MKRATIAYIPSSHLDLFWLGNYHVCLDRGAYVLKQYLDRCLSSQEETFLVDTPVFLAYFLERHPDYQEGVVRLVREGRLEVGAAYIDRWETLVLGESLIRNLMLGKHWCQQVLGVDNPVAIHPDLPSMIPQIAQLCSQAGIKYYVTSRKVYETGKVWRHQAPDGSSLLVLNYPRHYAFIPLEDADIPERSRASARAIALEELLENFPQGIVPVAGSAGDLAARENFRNRYGRDLEAFVAAYRQQYPDLDFTYTVPSRGGGW
jgi:alpha-mannosidase